MKKGIALFIALMLLVVCSACSNQEDTSKPADSGTAKSADSSKPANFDASGAGTGTKDQIAAGDVITFGNYEQDNNTANGPEPIEWMVLDVRDGKALLLSKYGLAARPYNTGSKEVSWEACALRAWMNQDFLNTAFNAEEQKAIQLTELDNSPAGMGYDDKEPVDYGDNTKDMVFLLCYGVVHRYFDVLLPNVAEEPNPKAFAAMTEYAIQSATITGEYQENIRESMRGIAGWWIRIPRGSMGMAGLVGKSGCVNYVEADMESIAVRAALWLNLNSGDADTGALISKPEERKSWNGVSAGSIIRFGSYEQDNNPDNGPEPIEWMVLDVQDGKALLLSGYGLEAKPYNTEMTDVTWETCTLRAWLNSDFLNQAFGAMEQTAILTTLVDNSTSQGYSPFKTTGGNNTEDKVFLLSYAEATQYLHVTWEGTYYQVCAAPTEYAIKTGAYADDERRTTDGKPTGWWWLRSPGSMQYKAECVISGSYYDFNPLNSTEVNDTTVAIRPAIWVNLQSGIF